MSSVLIAVGSGLLYILAYHTYGKYLARKIFKLEPDRVTPAHELNDGVDYVPSAKAVVFGHHFVSIAGTGPIVGPAIAIIWGWVPALLWIVFGSIFMGAVHDFGALVLSLRHRGDSVGEISREIINPRVRILFLSIVLFSLLLVLAVFGLVIATVFKAFPESVFAVWFQIPIAVGLGIWVRRRGGTYLLPSVAALALMYITIILGGMVPALQFNWPASITQYISPVAVWTIVLVIYNFFASTLPVQTLLQPRDYINSNQLTVAMVLILLGVIFSRPELVAPAVNMGASKPVAEGGGGAVPFFPFLFITVACGAISGFHALVSSGVSSKQISKESHALSIGYGAMLLEGFLGVLVVIAVAAGIGMDYKAELKVPRFAEGVSSDRKAEVQERYDKDLQKLKSVSYEQVVFLDKNKAAVEEGSPLAVAAVGRAKGKGAWAFHYRSWDGATGAELRAFVTGAANMVRTGLHIPMSIAMAIMGVLIASFAGTTMDTATRLQRYVIAELAREFKVRSLGNRFVATGLACVTALALALCDALWDGLADAGKGALIIWPLFSSINQILAALALLVLSVWLYRQRKPLWVTVIPMVLMFVITGWAMIVQIREYAINVFTKGGEDLQFLIIGALVFFFEIWMVVETLGIIRALREKRSVEVTAAVEMSED